MTVLGHAAAHERLVDLALEPGALDRVGPPATDPLSAHLATCNTCDRVVRAARRTHAALEAARGSGEDRLGLGDLATDEPIDLPAELRASVLGAIRDLPAVDRRGSSVGLAGNQPRPAALASGGRFGIAGRRFGIAGRLLPLVAVLGIVAVGAGLLLDQASRLDRARGETAALEALAVTVDRILRDPGHRVVGLRGADGTATGSVSWSSRDIAVVALSLEPPPPDRVYSCWIERGGVRSPVGEMLFAGRTAYWNGSLDAWATTSFAGGGTFGISLEPVSGSVGNPAVLAADLGS